MECSALSHLFTLLIFVFYAFAEMDVERLVSEYIKQRVRLNCKVELCYDYEVPESLRNVFYEVSHCCSSCSCEPDCVLYNTCCPDYLFEEDGGQSGKQTSLYACIYPHESNGLRERSAYWLVSRCPADFSNKETLRSCEEPDMGDIIARIPVYNNTSTSGLFYRNKHCAECHSLRDDQYEFWTTEIDCLHGVFNPKAQATIVSEIMDSSCSLTFIPPTASGLQACEQDEAHTSTINTCNVSGHWETYDSFLDEACNRYRAVFTRDGKKYNNVFCFACNVNYNETLAFRKCDEAKNKGEMGLSSFTALFDFRPRTRTITVEEEEEANNGCSKASVYDDYKGVCRAILCPQFSVLDEESQTCRRAYTSVRGVYQEVFIRLTAFVDKQQWTNLKEQFTKSFFKKIWKEVFLTKVNPVLAELYLPMSETVLNMSASSYYVILYFKFNENSAVTKQLVGFDQTMVNFTNEVENITFEFLFELDKWIKLDLLSPEFEMIQFSRRKYPCRDCYVWLTGPLCLCEAITLQTSQFNWSQSNGGLVIGELNWTLRNIDFEFLDSQETIKVCLTSYRSAIESIVLKLNISKTSFSEIYDPIAGILSLVCVSTSLVCLAVTFVTYCVFQELRTVPGKNNMALTFCMFVTQALFQFGFNSTEIGILCKGIGILIHTFLLLSLFWMQVCSFHMFRTFRTFSMPSTRIRLSNKVLVFYAAYTSAMTAVLVSVNILVTLYLSGGEDFGYGKDACYISYDYMIAFTTTLPALVIVLTNLTLFLFVVCTIRKLPEVPSETVQNRNYFSIYIKLSTLTGITYILAVPLFLAFHPVLNYAFIVFNASQGVFIMFAFVCNKQVKKLFSKTLDRVPKRQSSSGFTSSSTRSTNI